MPFLTRSAACQHGGRLGQGPTTSRLIPGGCDSSRLDLRVRSCLRRLRQQPTSSGYTPWGSATGTKGCIHDKIAAKLFDKSSHVGEGDVHHDKTVAQKIVYGALDIIKTNNQSEDPLDYFQKSINNVKPSVEVKSRRVGGATYQVPMEVRSTRAQALAFKWILSNSKKRNEKTQRERLANELIDAFENKGNSVKKKDEVHKMAEANRAFAHYRW